MDELRGFLEEVRGKVDAALPGCLPQVGTPAAIVREAAVYSLSAGGKRIRPCLTFAAGRLLGATDAILLPFACAMEMIHTYSLIHDDLPAMDNDDFRRGRPTCHKVYGEGMAILAGDALLTEAFGLMTREGTRFGVSPAATVAAIGEMAEAAGVGGMVGGQAADLQAEGKGVDLAAVEFIHRHKTGALLRASVTVGAILGGADSGQYEALATYGRKVGLAFQITDDILDEEGSAETLGKTPGKDRESGKATFPAVMGLAASKELAARTLDEAIDALSPFGDRASLLLGIARLVATRRS
jgi:geranylgeranyl diphosphate synthase type II